MKPVLQSLLIADHVYEAKGGKKIICGTFNRLFLTKQPSTKTIERPDGTKQVMKRGGGMGPPDVYISLTDVLDDTICELQFVSLTRNAVFFKTAVKIQCKDRLANVEIVIPLPPLDIPEPGVYAFEIVCEGEVIGSHRIVAIDADQVMGK